jgi:hypothetical protein
MPTTCPSKLSRKSCGTPFYPTDSLSPTKFASQRFFLPQKTSLLPMTTASTSSLRSRPRPMLRTTPTGARSASFWPRLVEKPGAIGTRSIHKTGCFSGLGEFAVIQCRFPKEYHDDNFSPSLLVMLGAKSTLKERWRQVLTEAERIPHKHLCTLKTAISANQTDEIKRHDVQLVIPVAFHETYSEQQRQQLWTVGGFVDFIKSTQRS